MTVRTTSERDAALIEASLEAAGERAGDVTPLVYQRLFVRQPDMEPMFWRDTDGSVKGEMLTRVFEAILDFLGPRAYASTLIQCEVVTHDGYGVPPEVFGTFFGVVADTMADILGAAWDAETAAAWGRLLADLDHYVTHPDQYAYA
jgi:hemoglobin-like flavoprotein